MDWKLQDARNQFSRVVQLATLDGPQVVRLRSKRAAIVLSAADTDALIGSRPSLVDHLLGGRRWDDDFVDSVGTRASTPSREVVF